MEKIRLKSMPYLIKLDKIDLEKIKPQKVKFTKHYVFKAS